MTASESADAAPASCGKVLVCVTLRENVSYLLGLAGSMLYISALRR